MNKIYNTIPDQDYYKKISKGYENGALQQWLLYTGDAGLGYYDMKNQFYLPEHQITFDDYISFGSKHCFKPGEKVLLISLGCGNSEVEKRILTEFSLEAGYNINYLGVDTSFGMLESSRKNLSDFKNNIEFMRADFGSDEFLSEIGQLKGQYDKKIFAFFGQTFGNIKHTSIINILYNLLEKKEKIWIDISLRRALSLEEDLQLHEQYTTYINNSRFKKLLTDRLVEDGIPLDHGGIILETHKVSELNTLVFTFLFLFSKTTKINIRNEYISFLPGSKVELLKIHRYDVSGLENFFNEYGFNSIDKQIKGFQGQFLFEKK